MRSAMLGLGVLVVLQGACKHESGGDDLGVDSDGFFSDVDMAGGGFIEIDAISARIKPDDRGGEPGRQLRIDETADGSRDPRSRKDAQELRGSVGGDVHRGSRKKGTGCEC